MNRPEPRPLPKPLRVLCLLVAALLQLGDDELDLGLISGLKGLLSEGNQVLGGHLVQVHRTLLVVARFPGPPDTQRIARRIRRVKHVVYIVPWTC